MGKFGRVKRIGRFLEPLESRVLLDGEYFDWGSLDYYFTPSEPTSAPPVEEQPPSEPTDTGLPYDDSVAFVPEEPVLLASPPSRPYMIVGLVGPRSVQVTWWQPNDDADSFTINRRGPTGESVQVAVLPGNARTFTDTGLLPGTRYWYTVTALNDAGDTPSHPDVIDTPGVHVAVAGQPKTVSAGAPFTVTAALRNATNQTVRSAGETLSLTLASGPAGAELGGTTTAATVDGLAVFAGLSLTIAGTYTLSVTDGITTAATKAFTVTPDAATSRLVLTQQPDTGNIGKGLGLKFAVEDAFGNVVKRDASKVTLTLVDGSNDGALKGRLTASVQKGIAKFTSAALTRAGTYTLSASDARLAITTPVEFNQEIAKARTTIPVPRVASRGYAYEKPQVLTTTFQATAKVPFTGEALVVAADGTVLATTALTPAGKVQFTLNLAPGVYSATIQYAGYANHSEAVSRAFSFRVKAALTPPLTQPLLDPLLSVA